MKPQKITPEERRSALGLLAAYSPPAARSLEEHIAVVEAERDEAKRKYLDTLEQKGEALREVERAEAERDALRERVEALDAGQAELFNRCQRAESTLSAIRRRAGDTMALVRVHQEQQGCASVARYIVGDGTALEATPTTVDPLHPTGRCACAGEGTCAWCCDAVRREAFNPEPTTAEAFATVRAVLQPLKAEGPYVRHPDALAALALLERRMGAQETALRRLLWDDGHLKGCKDVRRSDGECMSECALARAALVDDPPVFTLETPVGFGGVPVRILGEATDGVGHEHSVRLVLCRFPDGAEVPYLQVAERGGGVSGVRLLAMSTAVHALLNLGESEIFEVGNRNPKEEQP